MGWIDTYSNLLDDNSNYDIIDKFIEEHIPTKLYRYRCYGVNWLQELYNEEIYMCNPINFNDPFDSMLSINLDTHINYLKKFYLGDRPINMNSEATYNRFKEVSCLIIEGIRNTYRIACFTPFYNSVLMWSHYANSHTGYCIEYNVKKMDLDIPLLPVIYASKRYDATKYLTGSENCGFNHLLHKAKEWEYENEWRIVGNKTIYNEENGKYLKLPNTISGIYLGINSDTRNEVRIIKEWAKEFDIPIYKMRISKRQYKLIKERI